MPIYEYQCERCGPFSENRRLALSAAPAPCPGCGGAAPRVLSAPAVLSSGRAARALAAAAGEPRLVRRPDGPEAAPGRHDHRGAGQGGGAGPWMIGH